MNAARNSYFAGLVFDCKCLVRNYTSQSLIFVPRAADSLASLTKEIVSIVTDDVMKRSFLYKK